MQPLNIFGIIMIIIGIIMAVVGLILLIVFTSQKKQIHWYIWFLIIGGAVLFIIGIIMLLINYQIQQNKKKELAALAAVEKQRFLATQQQAPSRTGVVVSTTQSYEGIGTVPSRVALGGNGLPSASYGVPATTVLPPASMSPPITTATIPSTL